MSLLLRGIKGLGSALYATPGAVVRGGVGLAEAAYAAPGALKNGTVQVVSTLASGTLRTATALKDTSVQLASSAVSGSWEATKWAATSLGNGAVSLLTSAKDAAIDKSAQIKDAAIDKSAQNYNELFFRIQSVENKIFNALSGELSLTQFNRHELAEKLEDLIKSDAFAKTDRTFVLRLCNDLRNPNVIFDKSRESDLTRLEKILPPDFKPSLTQFNRNELAAKLDDLIKHNAFAETDRSFVTRLCNDLRNPSVIFDKSRKPDLTRLEKILPPDFTMPVSQANRNELAERLEEFVGLYNLKPDDKKFITGFCQDLRDGSILFDKSKLDEMGRLEKILNPYFAQHEGYISSKIAELEELKKVPGLTTLAPPKLTPAETLDGIEAEVDLLKSNSIKCVLGTIILGMTLEMDTFEGIDFEALEIDCNALEIAPPRGKETNLINFLIEVSNKAEIKGKSSEKVFKDLLYRVIDNSGKNIFTRLHAKFRCRFLFGLISNLVGNLFDNLKATLVHFAKLPPAKQLEEITKLFINPLLEHLSAVDGSRPAVPRTSDQILDEFIETLLAQFLDRKYQSWTRTARANCIEKAYRSGWITKAFYSTLAVLLLIAGKIISPVRSALNEKIHEILKKSIVDLCPSLSDATKTSLGIGTEHAWHSLKNSLLRMLQQARLTNLLPRAEDPIFQPPKKLPAEVKETLTTALDKLFKILATADESQTPAESQSALSTFGKDIATLLQQNMNGERLSWLKDIIKTAVTELTLDMAMQDGFISGTLLSSLASTNANGFQTSNVSVSTVEKHRVDVELQKELGLLGGTILQAVNNASRSDRSNQTYANTHITAIKQHVQAFNKNLLQLQKAPELSFRKHALEACARFAASMINLQTKITETVDASTQAQLLPHIDKAFEHLLKISEKISEAHPTEVLRTQVEAKLNALYALPLDHIEEIDKILIELRALKPSFLDVEGLAKDLLKIERRRSSKLFLFLVADYKDRANRAAQVEIKKSKQFKQSKIDSTLESAQLLAQWANELKFVKVQSKLTAKDAGFAQLYSSPVVNAATGATIQAYSKNFFTFIGNEKNLAGIVQRTMRAYLTKKAMMPKKKQLDVGFFPTDHSKKPHARPLSATEQEKLATKGWTTLGGGGINVRLINPSMLK